jgi:sporulation protein YlmC with PRC-barrel domain
MAGPKLARYNDIVPAKTVIGSTIVNANYEDLGRIEDLVLDAGAGRIAYAVEMSERSDHGKNLSGKA